MPVTTISAVCHLAAQDLGIIAVGETLSADLLANFTTRLHEMYASWMNEELMAVQEHYSATLTAGTADYTLGVGGTLNVGVTPIRVTAWQSVDGNYKSGGVPLSFAAFNTKIEDGIATTAKLVKELAADNGGPFSNDTKVINIRVWPTPAASPGTLKLVYYRFVDQIVDPLTLPSGWQEAVHLNLAVRNLQLYMRAGQSPEVLVGNAKSSKLEIMKLNAAILGMPAPQ